MRHFAAILLILLLAFMPSCKNFKIKKLFHKKADKLLVLQAQQDSIRAVDSIRKVQERLLAIETARLDSVRLAEEARLALASKYNIIVGSFITPEYAKAWVEEYRSRGYDPKIIKMENSRFELVSAETHESVRKAISRLNQFQDTVQVDAWIYIKK
jgi:predicted Zn-dependent peptidase